MSEQARSYPQINFYDLKMAINEFEATLPGWWWSLGACSVSRHASCGPDAAGPDAHLLELDDRTFDNGFHDDLADGSLADALRSVMRSAVIARAALAKARGDE